MTDNEQRLGMQLGPANPTVVSQGLVNPQRAIERGTTKDAERFDQSPAATTAVTADRVQKIPARTTKQIVRDPV